MLFIFAHPAYFLLLIPLWTLTYIAYLYARHKANPWLKVCDVHLLKHLLIGSGKRFTHWPFSLLAWFFFVITLALSGPSWSEKVVVTKQHTPYVFVLDLSSVMRAQDIVPARWQRAVYKVQDLLDQLKGHPVGLIVFSRQAFLISPITFDARTIRYLLAQLKPDLMPVDGYALRPALVMAQQLITQSLATHGHVMVVSGGHPGSASIHYARTLSDQNIYTSALAVGTLDGAPVLNDQGHFMRDVSGRLLTTGINTQAYAALARAGRGQWALFHHLDEDVHALLHRESTTRWLKHATGDKRHVMQWINGGAYVLWLLFPLLGLFFRRGMAHE